MERRKFLKSTAFVSACSIGTALASENIMVSNLDEEYHVKITVLKKSFQKEFADKYRNGKIRPCPKFEEGQEFKIQSPWSMPKGFCEWAWADIRTYIHDVHSNTLNSFVACCTDGFRPVFFSIERI